MLGLTSISLFTEINPAIDEGNTVVIFGMTRGGTSMVAGAVKGFGYDLGSDLLVNQEDDNFFYKTDEHMEKTILENNRKHKYWGWKYPLAADYIERLMPRMRNPAFVIVTRDPVATASNLVRWDDREPSGAISEAVIQMQKNIILAIRLRAATLFVSYEKACLDAETFLLELEMFLNRPLVVDRDRLLEFMVAGSYKSFEEVVLRQSKAI